MADLPDSEDLSPEATLIRHRALAAVIEGARPMDWDMWSLPIYDAFEVGTLTMAGRRTALWAVDLLRRALGKDCLARVIAAERKRQERLQPMGWWDVEGPHLIFGGTLWPGANSAPWVFANLLHIAAQIGVTLKENREVRDSLRRNLEVVNWVHGLLQLEVAGLGRQAGWRVAFENALGTGKHGDVHLQGPSGALFIEATTLRMSQREINALHTARQLTGLVMHSIRDLAAARGLHVSGKVDTVYEQAQADGWVHAVTRGLEDMASDDEVRDVTGPTGGTIHLSRMWAEGASFTIAGPVVSSDPFLRLQVKINDKARQWAHTPQPGWLRVEEVAGVWSLLQYADLSVEAKLDVLSTRVQQMLQLFPQLAGVILAPAPIWASNISPEALHVLLRRPDGTAALVRSALPYHRARETVIVAQQGSSDPAFEVLVEWYGSEASWLDWALAQMGQPPLRQLVREAP
jgi:hypothetical protein